MNYKRRTHHRLKIVDRTRAHLWRLMSPESGSALQFLAEYRCGISAAILPSPAPRCSACACSPVSSLLSHDSLAFAKSPSQIQAAKGVIGAGRFARTGGSTAFDLSTFDDREAGYEYMKKENNSLLFSIFVLDINAQPCYIKHMEDKRMTTTENAKRLLESMVERLDTQTIAQFCRKRLFASEANVPMNKWSRLNQFAAFIAQTCGCPWYSAVAGGRQVAQKGQPRNLYSGPDVPHHQDRRQQHGRRSGHR